MPWLWRLVTGLSAPRPRFNPGPVRVRFVVGKVTLGQISLHIFRFSPVSVIPPIIHTPLYININLLRTTGRSLRSFNRSNAFPISGGLDGMVLESRCLTVLHGTLIVAALVWSRKSTCVFCDGSSGRDFSPRTSVALVSIIPLKALVHPLERTNGHNVVKCCSFGTLELRRALHGQIFGSDTDVIEQTRKRRIARVCAVGGTQVKKKKLVKSITSEVKLCQSLKVSQIQYKDVD